MIRGDRIKQLRERKGLTLEALGEMSGVKLGTIWRYEEKPDQTHQAEIIAKIAKALEVSADYLLGLVDDPGGYHSLSEEHTTLIRAYDEGDLPQIRQLLHERVDRALRDLPDEHIDVLMERMGKALEEQKFIVPRKRKS